MTIVKKNIPVFTWDSVLEKKTYIHDYEWSSLPDLTNGALQYKRRLRVFTDQYFLSMSDNVLSIMGYNIELLSRFKYLLPYRFKNKNVDIAVSLQDSENTERFFIVDEDYYPVQYISIESIFKKKISSYPYTFSIQTITHNSNYARSKKVDKDKLLCRIYFSIKDSNGKIYFNPSFNRYSQPYDGIIKLSYDENGRFFEKAIVSALQISPLKMEVYIKGFMGNSIQTSTGRLFLYNDDIFVFSKFTLKSEIIRDLINSMKRRKKK